MKYLVIAFAFLLLPLSALSAELAAAYGDWEVYTFKREGKEACYATTIPSDSSGNFTKRGQAYITVRFVQNNIDEVSISSGYKYKEGQSIKVKLEKEQYLLKADNETAWAPDMFVDKKLIQGFKKYGKATVSGTSTRGTTSSDIYSLKGFSQAYSKMKELCGK